MYQEVIKMTPGSASQESFPIENSAWVCEIEMGKPSKGSYLASVFLDTQ